MITEPKSAETIASRMLDQHGLAFIWDAHIAAAAAYALGKLSIATDLIEIAEAAEQLWLKNMRDQVAGWKPADPASP